MTMTSEEKSKALMAKDEALRQNSRQISELMGRIDRLTASLDESNRNMAQVTVTLNGVIDSLRRQLEEVNRANEALIREQRALKDELGLPD